MGATSDSGGSNLYGRGTQPSTRDRVSWSPIRSYLEPTTSALGRGCQPKGQVTALANRVTQLAYPPRRKRSRALGTAAHSYRDNTREIASSSSEWGIFSTRRNSSLCSLRTSPGKSTKYLLGSGSAPTYLACAAWTIVGSGSAFPSCAIRVV